MHHVYEIGVGFVTGAVVCKLYFVSAETFALYELKRVRDEFNALKSKIASGAQNLAKKL